MVEGYKFKCPVENEHGCPYREGEFCTMDTPYFDCEDFIFYNCNDEEEVD